MSFKKKKLKNIVYRIQKIFLNKNRPICMLYKWNLICKPYYSLSSDLIFLLSRDKFPQYNSDRIFLMDIITQC